MKEVSPTGCAAIALVEAARYAPIGNAPIGVQIATHHFGTDTAPTTPGKYEILVVLMALA